MKFSCVLESKTFIYHGAKETTEQNKTNGTSPAGKKKKQKTEEDVCSHSWSVAVLPVLSSCIAKNRDPTPTQTPGRGQPSGSLLAGVGARDRQGHHLVPLRHLAVHPQERRAGAAEDHLRARVRGRSRRTEDEQEPGERNRPPRNLRTVSFFFSTMFFPFLRRTFVIFLNGGLSCCRVGSVFSDRQHVTVSSC